MFSIFCSLDWLISDDRTPAWPELGLVSVQLSKFRYIQHIDLIVLHTGLMYECCLKFQDKTWNMITYIQIVLHVFSSCKTW